MTQRDLQPEIMDQPNLAADEHASALKGLGRINALSNSAGAIWRRVRRSLVTSSNEPLRILDLASGGGDTCLRLWKRAKKDNKRVLLTGWERSETAIQLARRHCSLAGSAIHFEQADVLEDPLPKNCDVIICSLFLHHLESEDVIRLLKAIVAASPKLVLISDLRRSQYGYLLAIAACHLLTRSRVVHFDGPQSVAAAFTLSELRELSIQAGMTNATIDCCWPARVLLEWKRGDSV